MLSLQEEIVGGCTPVLSEAPVAQGRVLVVDDSRLMRALVSSYLRKAGFTVDEAADGQTALRCLDTSAPDVVITDLMMPGLDGFGLIEAIRARSSTAEVILVTGRLEQDVVVRALRLGAHDFLTKPLSGPDAVVLAVSRAREKKRLRDTNERLVRELQAVSRTDALTGVSNRRVFDEVLEQETGRARRYGVPLSLAMFDVDHFKKINDTCGHPGGDAVLQEVASRLRGGLRESDRLFRYGGEEFAVLFVHTPAHEAVIAVERLLGALRAAPIQAGPTALSVTASAGIAVWSADVADPAGLVACADRRLYAAKREGRDRAVCEG